MKKIFTILVLSLLISSPYAKAQGHVNYNNKWYLGINFGGTYHSQTETEVNGLYRAGFGFTLGRSFNYHKGSIISWDIRGRYLFAAFRGLANQNFLLNSNNVNMLGLGSELSDYQQTYGYYRPNFHTWVHDWSLELQLNTNLLREKTGWNLFVFGGIGTTSYTTDVDLYDNDVSFSIKPLDQFEEKGQSYTDYETQATNRREWVPSFGAGISKQISPNISFEVMGRMTWTRNNDFDANLYNLDGTLSDQNDIYHYASAGFKFRLNGGNSHGNYTEDGTSNSNNNTNTNPNGNNNTTPQKPRVDFTNPATDTYTTNQNTFYLKANVFYVDNAQNVKFVQDGNINNSFSFNPNTNEFSAGVNLHNGNNIFEITGTNQYGSDKDLIVIIKKEEEQNRPPVVTFITPSSSPKTVSVDTYYFKAKVLHVNSRQDITVTFNGQNLTNFNFNPTTKSLTTTLNLNVGNNIITVTGVNKYGQDTETATIIFKRPVEATPPMVTITYPFNNPYTTNVSAVTVKATVKNVVDKQHITVKLNGQNTTNFSFNPATDILVFPINNLVEGSNTVLITGVNNDGQAQDDVTIIYAKPNVNSPPTVEFIAPLTPGTTVNTNSYTVKAVTTFITNKNQIILKHNGTVVNANTYTFSNSTITYPATLALGSNVFDVVVTNNDGTDHKTTSVIFKRVDNPCVTPTIGYVSPQPNSTLNNSNVTIEAQINNHIPGTIVQLYRDNILLGVMSYNSTTSIASKSITLIEGNNSFKIKVSNECGNNQSTFNLIYNKGEVPCHKPSIAFVQPTTSIITTENSSYTLKLSTAEITSATQIEVTNNNTIIPFNFDVNSKEITIQIDNLVVGLNSVKITVTNNCGNDKAIYNITRKVCNPAFITINSNTSVTNAIYILNAQILNINDKDFITVKLNGVSQNFNFNESTSILLATLNLQSGNNQIEILVNKCKKVIKKIDVTYTPPCDVPVIAINSSNSSTSPTYVFKANVTNIDNANNITVKHNGAVVNSTFIPSSGQVKAYLTLVEGSNAITIIANGCEKIINEFVVNYEEPCVTPTINVTTNSSSTSSSYTLTVT
ncbi:MAG TPA: hypothetical protein EYG85_07600, partial [Crocinitomix sp.]|nr:hypothetical protein [Crocinitomix sp.]